MVGREVIRGVVLPHSRVFASPPPPSPPGGASQAPRDPRRPSEIAARHGAQRLRGFKPLEQIVDDIGGACEHGVRPLELPPQQVRTVRADGAAEVVRVLKRVFNAEQVALRPDALSPVVWVMNRLVSVGLKSIDLW